jgi:group I intron endonuclease
VHIKIAKAGKEKYPRKFQALHAAIAKYGIEQFTFEIIHEVETERESFDLEVAEIAALRKIKAPSYNLSEGGEGNSGWHHTKEAKQKMSKAGKGKTHSEEHRKAQSEAVKGSKSFMFGTHLTISRREKVSKLTEKEVKEIKLLLIQGIRNMVIAKSYHVSDATISMIKHGKIWSDII